MKTMILSALAFTLLSSRCMAQKYESLGNGICADANDHQYEFWYLEGWKSQKLIYKSDLSECKCLECESVCPATEGCLGFHYYCCKEGERCLGGASLLFSKGTRPQNPQGNWSEVGPRGSATSGPAFNGVGPITKVKASLPERTCMRRVPSPTPPAPPTPAPPKPPAPPAGDEALIQEWADTKMGVAFTMVSENGWRSGKWGVTRTPYNSYHGEAQTFLSIMTRNQPMSVYKNQPYGLLLHVTEESNFWKDFQVIGHGKNKDDIVGGPGDGGSHTPGGGDWRRSVQSTGKDYNWFTQQKNAILAKYNTVYHNRDYNEFITNGMRASAIAGVLKFARASRSATDRISDRDLCGFLARNVGKRSTPWPVYGYNYGELTLSKHLHCGGIDTNTNETVLV